MSNMIRQHNVKMPVEVMPRWPVVKAIGLVQRLGRRLCHLGTRRPGSPIGPGPVSSDHAQPDPLCRPQVRPYQHM